MAGDGAPPEDSMRMPRTLGKEARRTLAKATSRADQRRRLVHTLAFALFLVTLPPPPATWGRHRASARCSRWARQQGSACSRISWTGSARA